MSARSPPERVAFVLIDGVGDVTVPRLGGQTPLEAARTPHLDAVAGACRRAGRSVARAATQSSERLRAPLTHSTLYRPTPPTRPPHAPHTPTTRPTILELLWLLSQPRG